MSWAPRLTAAPNADTPLSPVAKLDEDVRAKPLNDRRERTIAIVLAIMVAAVALRIALVMNGPAVAIERAMEPDSPRYIELANNLNASNVFAREAERTGVVHVPLAELRRERGELEEPNAVGLRPEIFRTPGYPLLISVVLLAGQTLDKLLLLQCVLSVFTVLMVFLIGRQLYQSNTPAILAAIGVALHPADIVSSASLLSETAFAFMMILGLWLSVLGRRNPSWGVIGGLAIGAATLVRPISILLGLAIALWMITTQRDRKALIAAACIFVSSLIAPAAWMARNASVGYGWHISSVPTVNGYFYTANYIEINKRGGDYAKDWSPVAGEQFETLRKEIKDDETTFDAMKRLTVQTIKAEPMIYGKLMARSSVKLMTDHSAGALMTRLGREYQPTGLKDKLLKGDFSLQGVNDRPAFFVAAGWTIWNLLLAGLTVIGAGVMVYKRQWSALLLLGGIIVYFMLATQVNGLERFRVPIIGIQLLIIGALFAPRASENSEPAA